MSSACILIYATHPEFNTMATEFLLSDHHWRLYVLMAMFALGMVLSIYHVFSSRRKMGWEKYFMLFFAVLANGGAGIAAGLYALDHAKGIHLIFPFWNILSGGLLLLMFRMDIIDSRSVTDENARPLETLIGFAFLLVAFAIGTYLLQLYWAFVFSMCVAYATNVNKLVQHAIFRPEPTVDP